MARMTARHWAVALFGSLAVNVFLGGLIVTSYMHRQHDLALRMTVYTVPWAFRTIGDEVEPNARKVFRKYQPDLIRARDNLHEDYKLTTQALTAPQFDRQKFGNALARLRGDLSSAQETMHNGMVDFVSELTPEQRHELATQVNEWAEDHSDVSVKR